MNHKERLEEIKERVLVDKVYYTYLDGTKGHWGKIYTLNEEDYKYLYEQAGIGINTSRDKHALIKSNIALNKRVQELESRIADDEHFVAEILEQNKRYRKALEFYTEGKHVAYKLDETDDDLVVDYGETARKALEGRY